MREEQYNSTSTSTTQPHCRTQHSTQHRFFIDLISSKIYLYYLYYHMNNSLSTPSSGTIFDSPSPTSAVVENRIIKYAFFALGIIIIFYFAVVIWCTGCKFKKLINASARHNTLSGFYSYMNNDRYRSLACGLIWFSAIFPLGHVVALQYRYNSVGMYPGDWVFAVLNIVLLLIGPSLILFPLEYGQQYCWLADKCSDKPGNVSRMCHVIGSC